MIPRRSVPWSRRSSAPKRISTRPRGSEASSIWSTICANRYAKVGSHLAAQIAHYKVGAEFRLRRMYPEEKRKGRWKAAARYQREARSRSVNNVDARRQC